MLTTQEIVEQVRQAAMRLVHCYETNALEDYEACFDASASFDLTGLPSLESRGAWITHLRNWGAQGNRVVRCVSTNQRIKLVGPDLNAAIFRHDVVTEVIENGAQVTYRERETIVFECIGGAWSAMHEHLSPMLDAV